MPGGLKTILGGAYGRAVTRTRPHWLFPQALNPTSNPESYRLLRRLKAEFGNRRISEDEFDAYLDAHPEGDAIREILSMQGAPYKVSDYVFGPVLRSPVSSGAAYGAIQGVQNAIHDEQR